LTTSPIEFQDTHGNLRHGLKIVGLSLETDEVSIRFEQVEVAAQVQFRLRPHLHIQRLHLTDGHITMQGAPAASEPVLETEALGFKAPQLPLALTLVNLQMERITLMRGDTIQQIDHLQLSAQIDRQLSIKHFALNTPELAVSGAGRLDFSAPYALDATLAGHIEVPQQSALMINLTATGNLEDFDLIAETSGLANLHLEGQIRQLLTDPELEALLSGKLNINSAWALPEHSLMLEIQGSPKHLQIPTFIVKTLDGELTGNATVNLADQLTHSQLALNIQLAGLDFTDLHPDWPEQARLDGHLSAYFQDQTLSLKELNLRAPPAELRLDGQGELNLDTQDLILQISWSKLLWPPVINGQAPLLQSEQGTIQLSGSLDDWHLDIDAQLEALGDPATQLLGRLNGDTHQINAHQLVLSGPTVGVLNLEGEIQHQPELSGALNLSLTQFDPAILNPQLPGQVSAEVSLHLRDREHWTMDVLNLGGELRGQSLSGQGYLAVESLWPQQGNLALALGDNQLHLMSATADNQQDDSAQLWQLQLTAPTLSRLWPTISGSLDFNATIDAQQRQAQFEGHLIDSGYDGISLGQATFSGTLEAGDHPSAHIRAHLTNLDLSPWERIENLELSLVGDCLNHALKLIGSSPRGTLNLEADGALNHCDLSQISSWSGQLNQLSMTETLAGDWHLKAPMPMHIGQTSRFGPGCLTDNTGRLCLSDLTLAEHSELEVSIEALPMNLLLLPLDPAFRLDSTLSGTLQAAWQPDPGLTHLSGQLDIGAGSITTPDDELELLSIMGVLIQLTPTPEALQIDLSAALEGDSQIQGVLHIDDLNNLSSAQLIGDASLTLPDIGVFAALITELDQLSGRLDGRLALNGPLLAPLIEGQLDLSEGQLVHAPLGLVMTDIELHLDANQDQAKLSGQLTAGRGQLNIEGELTQREQAWQGQLQLDGQSLTLADVSWLQIESSPQIQLHWQPGRIDLDGDININRMRAGLPPGRAERISSSADITTLQPRTQTPADTPAPITLVGRLGIDLGPAARVDMIGIQTQLIGDLTLDWDGRSPNPTPRGTIQLRDGSYRAYGQNLAIESGQVVFTGHRVQNPAVNVEAIREIFGDPRVNVAGVRIRGQAQDPDIMLFTDPPTTDEKALAYLVTGADFDYAGGQAAVNIGVYLLPRLLVSYGLGLLETGNVLSGRYELSRRWGVRAVSGERDTGVDLSYAIDR
jgi:translocation and assembly module TamB